MHDQQTAAVANPPIGSPRVRPHLIYDDPVAAIAWLTRAFGFRERTAARHTLPDGTVQRTQMEVCDSLITLGLPSVHGESPRRGVSAMLYIYIDDVDQHYRHAVASGAKIVLELTERPWGDRCYQAADPEGHQWTFAQRVRDVPLDVCSHEPHEHTAT